MTATPRTKAFTALRAFMRTAAAWLATQNERRRQRRELGRLDDRLLRDIGVGRYDAEREIRKAFWK